MFVVKLTKRWFMGEDKLVPLVKLLLQFIDRPDFQRRSCALCERTCWKPWKDLDLTSQAAHLDGWSVGPRFSLCFPSARICIGVTSRRFESDAWSPIEAFAQ